MFNFCLVTPLHSSDEPRTFLGMPIQLKSRHISHIIPEAQKHNEICPTKSA